MTAGTSYPPLLRPLPPPPPDPRPPQLDSERRPAAESERSARPQLENKDQNLIIHLHNKTPKLKLNLTFLRVLDDLPDGLLQTVGSQHQLLSGFKDGSSCSGCGVGPWGAGNGAGWAMTNKRGEERRRQYDPLSLLLFFSDSRGRSRGKDGRGLRLLVKSLQQRVQFLLQDTTLRNENMSGETGKSVLVN